MGESRLARSGYVAVWVAIGPVPQSEPLGLDQRASRHRQARAAAYQTGRQLVMAYTSCPAGRQVWERDAKGRPLVVSPGGVHVSLSHAEAVVAAALSWDGPVGVDVERLRPLAHRRALAQTALSEAEQKAVDDLPEPARDAQVLRFWTRKEAVAKALGTGLATNLRAIVTTTKGALVSLPEECGDPAMWTLVDLPGQDGTGQDGTGQDGTVTAVAVRAAGIRVLTRVIPLPAGAH